MKYVKYIRDTKKREFFKKAEVFQLVLKTLFFFRKVSVLKAVVQKRFLGDLFLYACKVRIKNFCVITGRSRGIYKFFRVSRIQIRVLGASGLFFGLKKASW